MAVLDRFYCTIIMEASACEKKNDNPPYSKVP